MNFYDIKVEKRNGDVLNLDTMRGKVVSRISPIESPMVLEDKIKELLSK